MNNMIVSGEAILSAENSRKPMGGWGSDSINMHANGTTSQRRSLTVKLNLIQSSQSLTDSQMPTLTLN